MESIASPTRHSKPLLTVVTLSYNYAHYIRQTIESVLRQNFTDYEYLIIEDGSKDESPQIIEEYAQKYPQIRFINHRENKGIFARFEESVKEAKGTYIHWLSADDFYLPTFLEKSMQMLLANPSIPICCSDYGYIFHETDPNKILVEKMLKSAKEPMVFTPEELVKTMQRSHFQIQSSNAIMKKEMASRFLLNKNLKWCSDQFMLHQAGFRYGVCYIPQGLTVARQHARCYNTSKLQNALVHEVYDALTKLLKHEERVVRRRFLKSTLFVQLAMQLPRSKSIPFTIYGAKKEVRRRLVKILRNVFKMKKLNYEF